MSILTVVAGVVVVVVVVVVVIVLVDEGVGTPGRMVLVLRREESTDSRAEAERRCGFAIDEAADVGVGVTVAAAAMARRAFMVLLYAMRRRLLRFYMGDGSRGGIVNVSFWDSQVCVCVCVCVCGMT